MRVTKLTLRNIMGHEEYELDVDGSFTLVEGLNGQGKTSIIEAVRNLVGGGHDATLLRNGATEGEIVVLVDDGTEVHKTITPTKSSVVVRRPDVGQITAGQTYIRSLIDNIDPTQMLAERDESRRTQFLLEALPLELETAELREAVGDTLKFSDADLVGHPLVIVEKIAKRVYEERTGVNREAKAKAASIEQLSKSLPKIEGEDPKAESDLLESQRQQILTAGQAEATRLRIEAADNAEVERIGFDNAIEAKEAQIEALEDEKTQLQISRRTRLVEINAETDAAIEKIQSSARERLAEIKGKEAQLRDAIETRAAAANTRGVIAGFQEEHKSLSEKSTALSAALERIEDVKAGLLKSVPLKGVEIIDGVIHENGVPWPRINTGNRVKLAINLAKLRAKGLPLVPIDNIELLDGPTFEAFRKNAPKSGLQFIVTRVRQATDDKTPGLTVSGVGGKE